MEGYAYEIIGEPTGEPVVFLHGFSENRATWRAVAEELAPRLPSSAPAVSSARGPRSSPAAGSARGANACDTRAAYSVRALTSHPLVLVDLVGHGASPKPHNLAAYEIPAIIEGIEALRRSLGGARMHLVGYSMGGRMALAYAAAHPEGLASLVLEGASFGSMDDATRAEFRARDLALAARLRASTPEEFASWWEAMPVLASQRELAPSMRAQTHAMRAANDLEALALAVEGAGQARMPDFSQTAAQLAVPMLYVVGERDERYRAVAAQQLAIADRMRVRTLPAGHNVHLECPKEYAALLAEFLASVEEESTYE